MTLRLVPRPIEVLHRRRQPSLEERFSGEHGPVLRTEADWRTFGQLVFGDDRLGGQVDRADRKTREGVCPAVSNVIAMRLPKRRSSSADIQAVRLLEERRGKR